MLTHAMFIGFVYVLVDQAVEYALRLLAED